MICLSIKNNNIEEIEALLPKCDLAEIRLDLANLKDCEICRLFSSKRALIATCRSSEELSIEECRRRLLIVVKCMRENPGAYTNKYIDMDIDEPQEFLEEFIQLCKIASIKLILSKHFHTFTPPKEELCETIKDMVSLGADLCKIASYASKIDDCSTVISLYREFDPSSLLAFCMGDRGKFTRSLAVQLGSPFLYVAPNDQEATASGQFTLEEYNKYISPENYPFEFKKLSIFPRITAPASKSHSQRAIIAASLAKGKTRIYGYTPCNDSEGAIDLFSKLGVSIKRVERGFYGRPPLAGKYSGAISTAFSELEQDYLEISSPGFLELKEMVKNSTNEIIINTKESGLLSRIIIPVAAMLVNETGKSIVIDGEGSLLTRDMSECVSALNQAGFKTHSDSPNTNKPQLPLRISGNLTNNTIHINGEYGSQLVSGFLYALSFANSISKVHVSNPKSTPYIDITATTLKKFGVSFENRDYKEYTIAPNQSFISPQNITIEGDWSSASVPLVIGALTDGIKVSNLALKTGQADEKIFEVLKLSGARITQETELSNVLVCGDTDSSYQISEKMNSDLKNMIEVKSKSGSLKPFVFDASDSPDLFPALVLLALHCKGTSTIKGVSRLFNKESDRAAALFEEFTKIGAKIEIHGDEMSITHSALKNGSCSAHNDHRIAMALIGSASSGKHIVRLDNINCIDKSFPNFTKLFIN